jgi:diaminohydroxyphosphoribosylaminopyrimidine deaminase/5-amino-6-(5-phosphoribosylamino)uracil reductase
MSRVIASAREVPTWFLHGPGADTARAAGFRAAGARLIEVKMGEPGIDLYAALAALGEAGLTRLLVEGGAQLAAAMLRADLVDELAWFHAPSVIGGDGLPAAAAFGVQALDAMPRFLRTEQRTLGADLLTRYERA